MAPPAQADSPHTARLERARTFGFVSSDVPQALFRAKEESHDDGPGHGMFVGPIGGPALSRDLSGGFGRWHLQPGSHLVADVDAAFLAVRWESETGPRCARLRRGEALRHEVAALHPMSHEVFVFEGAPFRVVLTAFSPVLPGDEEASALPVVVFDACVEAEPGADRLPAVDVALFWPNLNGWRASQVTPVDRGDRAWPGLHHAGNVNTVVSGVDGACVLQSRKHATEGEREQVAVAVGGAGDASTVQGQFRVDPMATGVPYEEQRYTLGAVYAEFERTGRLGVTPDASWETHWHEPVGSAVASHFASGRAEAHARFVVGFDWPVVEFGQGRRWRRRYAAGPEAEAGEAVALARRALAEADGWLADLDRWQQDTTDHLVDSGWEARVAGCVVNELNLAVSLGTAWLDGTDDGHDPGGTAGRRTEHLGLLEGFDEGYFYYNTSDLWHYAFPALGMTWPRLADLVFAGLGDVLDAEEPRQRPIYRPAEPRAMLAPDKLPHDLGNPLEDPFVRTNGYAMRDDPNTWRDSNPAYVLATAAHHGLQGRPVDDATWSRMTAAAEVTAAQTGDDGVPRHEEFGDSTWDNLGLRGHSTYAAGLCTGMWAFLAHEAGRRGLDTDRYATRLEASRAVLDRLWTGEFFRAASQGKYTEAVMPDSLMGVFYADVAGVADVVDRERVRAHLRTGYAYAHRGYDGGRVGPLLVAEERLRTYERDGGQELQVNEVLVGSAWLHTAMLAYYGLRPEADDVARSLRDLLYGGTGLQFRTPAAVDASGHFRAPLNLRPLAAWWLAATGMRPTG